LDPAGDGGMAHLQAARRGREVAFARQRQEHAQVVPVGIHRPRPPSRSVRRCTAGPRFCRLPNVDVRHMVTLGQPRDRRSTMHFEPRLWSFTAGVRSRILWAVLIGLIAMSLGVARLGLLGWLIGAVFAGRNVASLAW